MRKPCVSQCMLVLSEKGVASPVPRSSTRDDPLTRRALRRYTDLQKQIAEIADRYPFVVEQYYDQQRRRLKARTRTSSTGARRR